jgi:hypothetical protein
MFHVQPHRHTGKFDDGETHGITGTPELVSPSRLECAGEGINSTASKQSQSSTRNRPFPRARPNDFFPPHDSGRAKLDRKREGTPLPLAVRRRRGLVENEVGMRRRGMKDLAGERRRRFFLCGLRWDWMRCGVSPRIPAHPQTLAAQPGPVPCSQSIYGRPVPIKDVGLIMTQRQTDVL